MMLNADSEMLKRKCPIFDLHFFLCFFSICSFNLHFLMINSTNPVAIRIMTTDWVLYMNEQDSKHLFQCLHYKIGTPQSNFNGVRQEKSKLKLLAELQLSQNFYVSCGISNRIVCNMLIIWPNSIIDTILLMVCDLLTYLQYNGTKYVHECHCLRCSCR